jgi:hypothetical protein
VEIHSELGEQVVRVRIRAALAVGAVAVGVVAPAAFAAKPARPAPRPSVVVALADSGVNPYHKAFYRPENTVHPCKWVKGFTDCSIPALNLSVGKYKDFAKAVAADADVWAKVQPHKWYWIPRTNIIGAVCASVEGGGPTDAVTNGEDVPPACILDEGGHGTGTASSVLSESPDALLLIHEGNAGADDMVTAPVTPDIQSHSWGGPGFVLPLTQQAVRPVYNQDPCPVGHAGPKTLVFLAAGNEAPTPTILDCARSRPDVQVVGGGYPGQWQVNSWTMYDFASWFCRPVASYISTTELDEHCGTSFSAPTAAGAAAAALLRLRQRDHYTGRSTVARMSPSVTRDQFVNALRNAATYTPKAKFPVPCMDPTAACWSVWDVGFAPLPENAPHLIWGYGWLDSTVSDAVVSCALRRACPAKSADARAYNEQRQQAKHYAGLYDLAPDPGDDAGSGRDAGSDTKSAVRVVPGRTYAGRLAVATPASRYPDNEDSYAFRGVAGQKLTITSLASPDGVGSTACWFVKGTDGRYLTPTGAGNVFSCDAGTPAPTGFALPKTGTYVVGYTSSVPQDYTFSVKLTR